jgi:hypothetical protein
MRSKKGNAAIWNAVKQKEVNQNEIKHTFQ